MPMPSTRQAGTLTTEGTERPGGRLGSGSRARCRRRERSQVHGTLDTPCRSPLSLQQEPPPSPPLLFPLPLSTDGAPTNPPPVQGRERSRTPAEDQVRSISSRQQGEGGGHLTTMRKSSERLQSVTLADPQLSRRPLGNNAPSEGLPPHFLFSWLRWSVFLSECAPASLRGRSRAARETGKRAQIAPSFGFCERERAEGERERA